MNKLLPSVFYTFQGLGNLVFGLFFISGGLGGGGLAMGIMIKSFLVFASLLSLFTALVLFLGRKDWTLTFGQVSSVLFGAFYAWMAFGSFEEFARQPNGGAALFLLLCAAIVVLNVAFFSFLSKKSQGINHNNCSQLSELSEFFVVNNL